MSLSCSNPNFVWTAILVETLYRSGLQTAVICPGSRSAPLTVAFAQHGAIEAIPVLDERSAAFFALGLAKQTGQAAALVCTSGTAGANVYGAVIEAFESRVPLLVLTADRPPELRACNAGQTVDQQKLFGTYPNWYSELAVPSLEPMMLAYLRQTLRYAWERTQYPVPGCVHLNLPFRDPLAPVPDPTIAPALQAIDWDSFFATLPSSAGASIAPISSPSPLSPSPLSPDSAPPGWLADRPLLIAGVAQPLNPHAYCQAIATIAHILDCPVLAEGLSPLRNDAALVPPLVSTYDLILRRPDWAQSLRPDVVIRVGEMPTSKVLRQWLAETDMPQWVIDPGDRNLDPLHGHTLHWRGSVAQLAADLKQAQAVHLEPALSSDDRPAQRRAYRQQWRQAEQQTRSALDRQLQQTDFLFEGKVAWLLSQCLPPETPLMIANSTAVRDVEWFWQPGDRRIQPFCNRGANGIDGTLSTAFGIAHRRSSAVLLTGDLALLHDTNGFLLRPYFQGHLTIVLLNNDGGGIFEMLPIAQFDPPFETFFATPQSINFTDLCRLYGLSHERIQSWPQLVDRLKSLPSTGVRILEVPCDRKQSAQYRQHLFSGLLWQDS